MQNCFNTGLVVGRADLESFLSNDQKYDFHLFKKNAFVIYLIIKYEQNFKRAYCILRGILMSLMVPFGMFKYTGIGFEVKRFVHDFTKQSAKAAYICCLFHRHVNIVSAVIYCWYVLPIYMTYALK